MAANVSARFLQSVIEGAIAAVKIDLLKNRSVVKENIAVESGSVSIDASAAVRRSLKMQVIDEDGTLMPKVATDIMMPFGTEVQVKVGFDWPNADPEYVDIGVFRMETVETELGIIDVTEAFDRSFAIAEARFERPHVIPANTNMADAVKGIIDSRMPGLDYSQFGSSALLLPLTVFEEGDKSGNPWQNCLDLAAMDGKVLYFDGVGRPVMREQPDPLATPPIYTFERGVNSTLIGLRRTFTARGVRNVFIVSGEGSGVASPIRSMQEITDATSPIFAGGAFGRRPDFFSSPVLTTQQHADTAATTRKRGGAGASEVTRIMGVPHPGLDAGDVVRVVDSSIGIDTTVVLTKFDIDFRMNGPVSYETLGRRWF